MGDRLSGDRPIFHPSDDALGFASFADALATSLLQMSPTEGLVISVEAPWGSGKSSAIALTLRTIKIRILSGMGESFEELEILNEIELDAKWAEKAKNRKLHIVRFNPWNFSGQENLVKAFFKELAGQLEIDADGKLAKAINQIAGYLPSVFGSLGAVGAVVSGSIPAAGPAIAAGRAAGEALERGLKTETSLESARSNLSKELREAEKRIIVIIDDLDRLMPSEMRAVLSLVKSLGDLPNVLYLLAYDADVVSAALQGSSEKIDPEFLEKIVQVSLKLPPPWRGELRHLLLTSIDRVIGEVEPNDIQRWQKVFREAIDPYLETPRDVTRLVNSLQVVWPNVNGDIDLTDLILITSLQFFDPKVYAFIRENIEIITYADYRYEDEKEFSKRMVPTEAKNLELAKKAMAHLFPRLATVWNYYLADSTPHITLKAHRRICTEEYHRNYFIFGRDPRMLSRAEVNAIVTAANPAGPLSARIKKLAKSDDKRKSPGVATLLEQIADEVYDQALLTTELLRALLDSSDDLIRREDEVWELYVRRNDDRLRSIILLGLEKLDAMQRERILDVLVMHPTGLRVRTEIIEGDAIRNGHFGGVQKHETERFFNAASIKKAALKVKGQIAKSCKSGEIWKAPEPTRLIWAWKRMGAGLGLDEWLKSVISDDKQVVKLAKELLNRSYQTGGRDGSRIVLTYNRQTWQKLFDVDLLMARLESLTSSSNEAKNILDTLTKAERSEDD